MSEERKAAGAGAGATAPAISDSAWAEATSQWLNSHVRNSPIAGMVEAWNHLGAALPQLRALLEGALKKEK